MEEKQHGKLRGIIVKVMIPLLLTVIIGAFLLNFVGFPVWKTLKDWGNKVPGLSWVIPDSAPKVTKKTIQPSEWEQKYMASAAQLKQKDQEIKSLNKQLSTIQAGLDELKTENAQLSQKQKVKKSQDFQEQMKQASDLYANIPESKAAAIIESMKLEEACYTLSLLGQDLQSSILGSMKDVKKASQLSMMINEIVMGEETDSITLKQQIHQLALDQESSTELLSETIAAMPPAQSAGIIQAMMETNSQVAMELLKNVTTSSRSLILAEIAKTSPKVAAQITANLN